MLDRSQNIKRLFYVLMGAFLIISIFSGIATSGESFKGVLFGIDINDSFMDFFNPLNHAATLNPYTAVDRIYPAFVYVGYYLIGTFMPEAVNGGSGLDIRAGQCGRFIFAIYMVVTVALLIYLVKKLLDGAKKENTIFMIAILSSAPFLYLFERANIIVMALIFSMLFLAGKDSENKIIRELSLVCLAIAACIKIYPALFGLLLLKEKRYKESARCALYGVLLFVLPFAYMGGFDKIGIMFESLMSGAENTIKQGFGYKVNVSNTVAILSAVVNGVYEKEVIEFGTTLSYVILGLSMFSAWFSKSEWRRLAICAILMAIIPGFSFMYALIFMVIPLIYFFKQKTFRRIDYIYTLLFVGIFGCFAFEQFEFLEDVEGFIPVYMATYVQSIAISIMIILLILEGFRDFICTYVVKREKIFNINFEPVKERVISFFLGIRDVIVSKISKISITNWFIILFVFVSLVFLARAVVFHKDIFAGITMSHTKDSFMDFYNSVHQAAALRPYGFGGVNPPLYYVFFAIIRTMIPFHFVATGGEALKFNQVAMVVFMVVIFILMAFMFYFIIKNIKDQKGYKKIIIAALLALSAPMLFTYERGSMHLLVLVLLLAHMYFRDSDKWWIREIAIFLLAVTNGLYFCMILFGAYYLIEKKYKEFFRYLLYSVVLWVGSLVMLGGVGTITELFRNINNTFNGALWSELSYNVGIPSLVRILCSMGSARNLGTNMAGAIVADIMLVVVFIAAFGLKEKWKKYLAVVLMVVCTPIVSPTSILILTIPAFILFINEEKIIVKNNVLYFVGFLLIYLSIPIGHKWFFAFVGCNDLSLNCLIDNIVIGVFVLLLSYEGFKNIIKNNTQRRVKYEETNQKNN